MAPARSHWSADWPVGTGSRTPPTLDIYILMCSGEHHWQHGPSIYIYPSTCLPPEGRGGVRCPGVEGPRGHSGGGGRPRRHARRTHHVTLRFFKRLSPTKNGNVTQLFEKVAHFVWCFCRARSTPIQKLSPAAISSHFNCILNIYTPNGVGESV